MAISDPNEFLGMNRARLTAAWKTFYKESMPKSLGDATLRLALAYRLQASTKGNNLSPAILKRLQQSLTTPSRRTRAQVPRYERYLPESPDSRSCSESFARRDACRNEDRGFAAMHST
jgi:hypothetical protein